VLDHVVEQIIADRIVTPKKPKAMKPTTGSSSPKDEGESAVKDENKEETEIKIEKDDKEESKGADNEVKSEAKS